MCLWYVREAGVNCDSPIHRRQRRCSIGRARLNYSFGAVDLQAFAVEARFMLKRSTQIKRSSRSLPFESIDTSKHSFKRARPSSMTGAKCKTHTRRSSKFKTAVRGDDRMEDIDTPNPDVHPQCGHVASGSFVMVQVTSTRI